MIRTKKPEHHSTAWYTRARCVAFGIALLMLVGALISPWGQAKSHGSAAIAVLQHGDSWEVEGAHGHSHEDEAPASGASHAHHAGDHTHDHAHAVASGLPALSQPALVWLEGIAEHAQWPSLASLERPPRA